MYHLLINIVIIKEGDNQKGKIQKRKVLERWEKIVNKCLNVGRLGVEYK